MNLFSFKMVHEELQIIKICQSLYSQGYTSIHFERGLNHSQNIIILRACLIHSYGNKKLLDENPALHKKLKSFIDGLNLRYFIKNPADKKRYNII